ncbi:hypothetical protein ACFE04_002984 [Oxalis oulophora]
MKTNPSLRPILIYIVAILFITNNICHVASQAKQVYIVYTSETKQFKKADYLKILQQVLKSRTPRDSLIYTYTAVFSGFAALLSEKEAMKMKAVPGVLDVRSQSSYSPNRH